MSAVFLDRDGTINVDTGYLSDPDEMTLIEGAAEAIASLNSAAVKTIVISNQSGIGRGYFTDSDAKMVNDRLIKLLAGRGARLDAIYYCPHRPEDRCQCRKPAAGLVQTAVAEHDIDVLRSCVIGDKVSDVELARNLGMKAALVLTGNGRAELARLSRPPDYIAQDLRDAVRWAINGFK